MTNMNMGIVRASKKLGLRGPWYEYSSLLMDMPQGDDVVCGRRRAIAYVIDGYGHGAAENLILSAYNDRWNFISDEIYR
jgi:hypothetical protein